MAIIDFEKVRFTYDGRRDALVQVDLHVQPGELVCVLGGNGSGKSTLAKHVNALLVPDGGTAKVLGRDTADPAQTYFIRSKAGMVFQNPDDQIVASVIEDDVAFGPENLGVQNPQLEQRVTEALRQVGLQGFQKKETAALSGGQKQRVAIAGVLAMEPSIIVFDEATAMLDPRGRSGLLRVCRELRDEGMTVVFITHFMEEAALADRVVVLDGGRVVLDGSPDEVLTQVDALAELDLDVPFAVKMSDALRREGVPVSAQISEEGLVDELRELGFCAGGPAVAGAGGGDDAPGERASATVGVGAAGPGMARAGVAAGSPELISFEDVSFTYLKEPPRRARRRRGAAAQGAHPAADWGNDPEHRWALRDVTFSVREGEMLGIAGHTGSGKSTLIQLCNGLLAPSRGTVRVRGNDLSGKGAQSEARREIGVVFQYPEHQLFAATVFDDVAFGPRNLGLGADAVEERVRGAMELVHLDLDELREKSPFALSGGQQRRVAFAGVLAMSPSALVLDEPIAGLDPRSRASFLSLIAELHDRRHLTVIMVSHSMDDLSRLCDRVLVLNQGRVEALGTPGRIFADEAAMKAIGLGVPGTVRLANALGMRLEPSSPLPEVDELARSIARLGPMR